MVGLLTTLWIDSAQFERALEYWGAELAKNPKDRDVLRQMAGINLAAGRHDQAIEWILKRVERLNRSSIRNRCDHHAEFGVHHRAREFCF